MDFQEFKKQVAANSLENEGYEVQASEFSEEDDAYTWQRRTERYFEMIRYSIPAAEWMVLCVEPPNVAPTLLEFGASLDEIC